MLERPKGQEGSLRMPFSYDGQHVLLCKGADDQVLENLSPEFVESDEGIDMLEKSTSQLRRYANKGLRTLCLAMRVIPREEYEEWMETREFVSLLLYSR